MDGSEKLFGNFFICIIVGAALSVNIGDFLVEPAFTGADITDTRQLLFKIVLAKNVVGVFQPFIIHGKAFDDVLFEYLGRPDAKMRRLP